VNKLDLRFDSKKFEVAFGEAISDSSSVFQVCRPDARAHSEGESESVGARLSRDGGQSVVHATSEDQCGSRSELKLTMTYPAPSAGSVTTDRFSAGHQSTEAAERALLALVSTGDRCAMDQLYMRCFARLAKFFENMTLRADLVEELINDTMLEVWNAGQSLRTNASVLHALMRLAYSRVQKYFADASDVHDWEQSKSMLATASPSNLQAFLFKLSVEERAVLHLVYASGCSRRETANVMNIACDRVDALLRDVRASAKLYCGVTTAHAIDTL
jgi:DNA-directed RNA polymerase specialized sigma24 family protein